MGEPGATGAFVSRSHAVPEVHGGQRYDMVFADHHPHAIAERVLMQRLFCHGALPSVRLIGWWTAPRASNGMAPAAGLISVSPYRVCVPIRGGSGAQDDSGRGGFVRGYRVLQRRVQDEDL